MEFTLKGKPVTVALSGDEHCWRCKASHCRPSMRIKRDGARTAHYRVRELALGDKPYLNDPAHRRGDRFEGIAEPDYRPQGKDHQ